MRREPGIALRARIRITFMFVKTLSCFALLSALAVVSVACGGGNSKNPINGSNSGGAAAGTGSTLVSCDSDYPCQNLLVHMPLSYVRGDHGDTYSWSPPGVDPEVAEIEIWADGNSDGIEGQLARAEKRMANVHTAKSKFLNNVAYTLSGSEDQQAIYEILTTVVESPSSNTTPGASKRTVDYVIRVTALPSEVGQYQKVVDAVARSATLAAP